MMLPYHIYPYLLQVDYLRIYLWQQTSTAVISNCINIFFYLSINTYCMKRKPFQTIAVAACLLVVASGCGKSFNAATQVAALSATQATAAVSLAGAPSDAARA